MRNWSPRSQLWRLGLALSGAAFLLLLDVRFGHADSIRAALAMLVDPLRYTVNAPVAGGRWLVDHLASREALLEQNADLKAENLLLRTKTQRYAALEQENTRLRELLDSAASMEDQVLVAELLAVQSNQVERHITVNKGARHGVFRGQPVVDATGVMGQVVRVNPFSCTVMLVSDLDHALPVQVNRSGLRAIAVGTGGESELKLANIPSSADLREGDLIVSSGIGGRFPPGYPVGQVKRIAVDTTEPFAEVGVTPSAQLGRAREVLLVWPRAKTDIGSPLENADPDLAGMDSPEGGAVREAVGLSP